jgi:hypothetical protein
MALPPQKLTLYQKKQLYQTEKNWYIACIQSLIRTASDTGIPVSGKHRMYTNYQLVNGIINSDEYQYVDGTEIHEEGLQYPIKIQNFNIIRPVIESLKGEYLQRPFPWQVYTTNYDAVDEKENELFKIKFKKELIEIIEALKKQGIDIEAADKKHKQWVASIDESDYKTELEALAHDLLEYNTEAQKLKDKFYDLWTDFLISDHMIGKVELIAEDEFTVRVCNPLYVYVHLSSGSNSVSDAISVVEERYLTLAEIWDQFKDYLTDEELEQLEKSPYHEGASSHDHPYAGAFGSIRARYGMHNYTNDALFWKRAHANEKYYRVFDCYWRSFEEVNVLITYENDKIADYEIVVDFPVNLPANQRKGKIWINCIREGVCINNSVFCKLRISPVQFRKQDNYNHCSLPFFGIIGSNKNSIPMSLVDFGKSYQHLYNVLWMRVQHEIAGAIGKVMLADLSQIAFQSNTDQEDNQIAKWLYHLKSNKIAFINSAAVQEATGDGNKAFNQWKEIDMALSQSVSQYIEIMRFLREEYERLTGITQQRQGITKEYETALAFTKGVVQSAAITESLFMMMQQVIKDGLEKTLAVAVHCVRKGAKYQKVYGGYKTKIIHILPEQFSFTDFDVHVSDSQKTVKQKEFIEEAAIKQLENKLLTLSDIIDLVREDSINVAHKKFKLLLEKREQEAQKMQQEQIKAEQEKFMSALNVEKEKIKSREKIEKMKTENDLKIAEMELENQIRINRRLNFSQVPDENMQTQALKEALVEKYKNLIQS